VIASTVLRARGSASGADVSDEYVFVYKLRDGLIVEGWEYRTKEEALEAAGLSEQAMSQENVELIRAAMATYNAGDFDAHLALYAPDAEWVPDTSRFPEAAPPHGRDGIKRFIEGTGEGFMNLRYELSEVFAVGVDRVLARGEWGGQGEAGGIETYSSLTTVWTVRHGEISRTEFFFDHDEALKAVGLAK
jgi:ketosteroid isomerase-like protein